MSEQTNEKKPKIQGLRLAGPSASTMQTWADRLGLCLSVACLIHCLATPILLIALPSLSFLVAEHDHEHIMLHEVLLAVLPLIAILAFIPGYRMHRKLEIFYWSLPGIAALAVGVLLSHDRPLLATAITILGSALLVRAHLLNRRECACCQSGHGHDSKHAGRAPFKTSKTVSTPLKSSVRLTEVKSTTSTVASASDSLSGERLKSGEL
jgi:MerC mercury resistance protein